MRVAKVIVQLSESALRAARAAVRSGEAASVDAYVVEAVEEKLRRTDLLAMREEMAIETGGPITEAERKRARRELGFPARRRTRRRS